MPTTTYDARAGLTTCTEAIPDTDASVEAATLPLGIAPDGHTACWNTDAQSGVLVLGPDRSTAAALLAGLAVEAARRDWRVWVCESHRGALGGLRGPNIDLSAASPPAVAVALDGVQREIDRRVDLVDTGGSLDDLPRQLVVLRLYDRAGPLDPMNRQLRDIALDGHPVRVHLVYAAEGSAIPQSLRDCFDVHILAGSPPAHDTADSPARRDAGLGAHAKTGIIVGLRP